MPDDQERARAQAYKEILHALQLLADGPVGDYDIVNDAAESLQRAAQRLAP